MPEVENSVEIPHTLPKKPRKPYTRTKIDTPPSTIPASQALNPNIAALESDIYALVKERSQAQSAISHWNQQIQSVQNSLRAAQDGFNRIEGEIQYRMGLVNQMRGGAAPQIPPQSLPYAPTFAPAGYQPPPPQSPPYMPAAPYPTYPPPFDPRMGPGVASYPAPNPGLYPDVVGTPEGAVAASADAVRMEEMRLRGY